MFHRAPEACVLSAENMWDTLATETGDKHSVDVKRERGTRGEGVFVPGWSCTTWVTQAMSRCKRISAGLLADDLL